MRGIGAIQIPEQVLRMVAGFLGIEREQAEQFVRDFHATTEKLIGTQDEILRLLSENNAMLKSLLARDRAQLVSDAGSPQETERKAANG